MIELKKFLDFSCHACLGVLSFLLSSCSIYNQHFDCPPPAGIPCASVTEIEGMIVETDQGADLIVKPEVEEDNHCFWCGAQKPGSAFPSTTSKSNHKVWVCSQKKDGCLMKGYYFQKSDTNLYSDCILEAEDLFTYQKKGD
jgi:hypothetical protein